MRSVVKQLWALSKELLTIGLSQSLKMFSPTKCYASFPQFIKITTLLQGLISLVTVLRTLESIKIHLKILNVTSTPEGSIITI